MAESRRPPIVARRLARVFECSRLLDLNRGDAEFRSGRGGQRGQIIYVVDTNFVQAFLEPKLWHRCSRLFHDFDMWTSTVPFLGFFEVLIWIIVVAQVMQNLSNWVCYIAYAGGFAAGTYVGLLIEEKLALGLQVIRVITNQNSDELIAELKNSNHELTIVDAQGAVGPVKMIFTIIKRKDVPKVVDKISAFQPNAFFTIEDVKNTSQGVFNKTPRFNMLFRKSK